MSSSVFTLTNRLNYLQSQVNQIIADSDTLQEVIDNGDELQGSAPTLDQVVKYDGTHVVWSDLPAPPADQTLQDVITVSDELQSTAPTLDQVIKYDGTNVVWSDLPAPPPTPSLQEVITVNDDLQSTAPTLDQVIKYDGTNVVWSDLPAPPATPSLQDVINVSDELQSTAPTVGQFIGYNGGTTVWSDLPVVTLDSVVVENPELDGSQPTTNQIIQYDGEFVVWADLPAPPATPSLQDVITVNDDLQSTAPTLDQVIKYNGTNVVWSDLPTPATPTLSSVLSAGNTASGASASVTLTDLPKQIIISPTSVFLNDTTIVQQATLNTEKLRLLTTGLTNDITSSKMSFTKPATSSINEYGTDGVALSGLFGTDTRSGGLNLNTGVTINNVTGKLTGTLNESFVSLDGDNSSTALGTKSTLNATGLTCVNKVTPSTTSSLSSTALNVGITGSTVTVNSSGVSSTNILNLNSSSQIDTNCSIRVLAVPPSSAGRSILSNGQLSIQNVASALQNTISSTSSAITNGTKTISMTVDGLSSTGAMSLGTATVALTTGSTGITQTYPSNTTALATTQYVTTAISSIPATATPTLQSVINTGNTITNGTKTLTLSVNGLDSTGEIVIGNVSGTTQLNGTTTATKLQSFDYDSNSPSLTVKLGNSLTTGNLELGNNITTGNINLGSKMTSGNLYMMNDALATGDITMLNPSATGKLLVRGAGISTNTITTTTDVKTNSINATSVAQDLDIGSNLRDTTISIGRLMIADGRVEIGSTASTINLKSNDCNAVTQTTGNNTTRVATCAFVNSSIAVIPVPTLQAVINKNDDLQGITPTTDQFIKYNGTNVIWSDLPTIPDGSITTAKLADSSVTTAKLADSCVNIFKLGNNSVSTSKIINGDVTTAKLSDGSVTSVKLENSSVITSKIADANVTNTKLDKVNIPLSGFGDPIASVSFGSQKITNLANPTLPQDAVTKAYVDAITIPDGSITTAKLADGSVTTAKLADLNVTTLKLADLNVTTSKLADLNVTTAKLADSSITTTKIADANVTNAKLDKSNISLSGFGVPSGPISFSSQKITNLANPTLPQDGATKSYVDNFIPTIPDGSITTAKLADLNVTTIKLADSSITTIKIADANVTNAKLDKANISLSGFGDPIANVSFNSQKITNLANPTLPQDAVTKAYVDAITIPDGSITTAKLADGSVTTAKLADLNVTTAKLADSNVTTVKIADLNVTTSKLADSSVGTNKIIDASVTTQKLGDSSVNIFKLSNNSVSTDKIIDGDVSTAKLADGSVTNAKLNKPSIPLSGFGDPIASVSLGSQKITNLANPTLPQDGATKSYVDSSISLSSTLTAGNTANNSIILSDATITTTYTKNSIVGNDDLTINSAATKLLKIGSGSATENVEIASQAGRSVVLHLGDGINNIAGSGVHINNGTNSVGNTQINNGSGQTGQINIGNATSGTTTTNLRGGTNIEGVVNINGVGSTNAGLITIGNTSVGAITNVVGTQVNLTNPRINQPISILYTSILPALGTAGLNQIGGRAFYYNNGGFAGTTGTGFFTTTGTTKQVYGFFNAVPTGRYLVSALLQMNNSLASMQVDMRTVYNTNTSPSFPQPLTLNQTATLGDSSAGTNTFSSNIIDFSDVKPSGARYNPFQSAVVDITPTIGNQLGLAITFGNANVGTSGAFSLFLNFSLLRIS